MNSIIKYSLYALFALLAYSCGTSKRTAVSQPVAIDMQTLDTIPVKSIPLQKGRICYVASTSYDYMMPDMDIFKLKNSSDFISSSSQFGLSGSYSGSYRTDTIIQSQYLIKTALEAVSQKSLPGFEFVYIAPEAYDNESSTSDSIIETYDLDYIISLNKLEFHISGNILRAATVGSSKYSTGDFEVTETSPQINNSGDILIAYDAIWSIQYPGDNQQREINQKGEIYSDYFKTYDLIEHLINSAQQAGKDFSSLLTSK